MRSSLSLPSRWFIRFSMHRDAWCISRCDWPTRKRRRCECRSSGRATGMLSEAHRTTASEQSFIATSVQICRAVLRRFPESCRVCLGPGRFLTLLQDFFCCYQNVTLWAIHFHCEINNYYCLSLIHSNRRWSLPLWISFSPLWRFYFVLSRKHGSLSDVVDVLSFLRD